MNCFPVSRGVREGGRGGDYKDRLEFVLTGGGDGAPLPNQDL